MMDSIIGFLLLSGISVSFFVIFHLFRQNRTWTLPNRIAVAIQLLWLMRFFLFYVKGPNVPVDNPFVVIYDQTLFFLDGVLVWLYVRSLLRPDKSFKWIWLHFIPFVITFAYSSIMAFFFADQVITRFNEQLLDMKNKTIDLSTTDIIFFIVLISYNLIYLYKSEGMTKTYNDDLKENLSNVDHLTINWVERFKRLWIVLFFVPLALYFGNYMQPVLGQIEFGNVLLISFFILVVVFNSFLLEQTYKPVSIFKTATENSSEIKLNPEVNAEVNTNSAKILDEVLGENQYYLDEELSLNQLANYMNMKSTELTALIKQSPYENFYDLINTYRVEEVKKQLKDTNEQIIQLAYQNGFRSKSTFNKIFKDKTGMTPRQYRLS